MQTINVQEAKAQLSRLLDAAARGEEIIISKAGKPYARLLPIAQPEPRRPGAAKGKAQLTPVFFEPLPTSELDAWE